MVPKMIIEEFTGSYRILLQTRPSMVALSYEYTLLYRKTPRGAIF